MRVPGACVRALELTVTGVLFLLLVWYTLMYW